MQGIEKEIKSRYNLEIKSIVPYKNYFIINSSVGEKILKKVAFSPGRIYFIHGAKEHLYNNFKAIDRYCCTTDGKPFFTYEDFNFTISDIVHGKECNFENRHELAIASKTLASLHRASRGYVPDERSEIQSDLGKMPYYLNKRLSELKRFKKVAKKGKYKFDYLFLNYADYFCNLAEDAINQISTSSYWRLVEYARKEGSFCHHDYTHNNIIMGEAGAFVINFDYCCFELRVYDVANLIRRKMRKCGWNIDEAAFILENYCSVEMISNEELHILKLLLQFPQKFWRVANRFYNSKRGRWERTYIAKLQEAIDEMDFHHSFINKFNALV